MNNVIEVRFGRHKLLAFQDPKDNEYRFYVDHVMAFLVQEDKLEINTAQLEEALKNGWFPPDDYLAFRARMGASLEVIMEEAKKLGVTITHDPKEFEIYEEDNEAERPNFRCS